MKKYTLALILSVLVPVFSSTAYEYKQSQGGYYTARPIAKTNTYKKTSTTRRTGGYNNMVTNNFYYSQSAQPRAQRTVSSDTGDYYRGGDYRKSEPVQATKTTKKVKKSYSTQERKFFLAHPFFQPLKGKFGSVTDVSYAQNRFNFDLLNGSVYGLNPDQGPAFGEFITKPSAKAENSQFAVKEDFSYGLTDTLALVLMAQYDKTKTTIKDWTVPSDYDSESSSGLNLFGIGLQNRFVDNNDWIVMGELFFEHQRKVANTLIGTVKAGYKIDRSTIYGLGRVSYTNLIENDIYGLYVDDPTGDWLALTYNTNIENIFQFEGGLGAFAVLNKYFTLNGEMTFGHYDWHNQLNLKGAIGWQPADSFALNLYASTVLYDSAKGKTRQYMNYNPAPANPEDYPIDGETGNRLYTDSTALYTTGDYKINNYNEWKIGVQAVLYF